MAVGDKEKIVIVGDGETAEVAFEYFNSDSKYEVAGFSVEKNYLKNKTLKGLPIVPFEKIEHFFNPKKYKLFVAISYTNFNRLRTRLLNIAKTKGYPICSFISSKAFIGEDASVGENCFILENVAIQRKVKIGDNVTVWSGSSIGHRSIIGNNCFIASQVAISGSVEVGENCFFGCNSCTVGGVKIGKDCIVGAGAVIINDAVESKVYVGNPAKPVPNKNVTSFISGKEKI
jgi:sugar O-acyltransferase (sialic acid O-acetyltransferase NeuD family)